MCKLKCVVCNDASTAGRHYGVNCCLGCKSFFRRAIIRKRTYFCEKNNACDVSERSGRQSCRACRLQKCFAAGMKQSALHPHRDMFGKKEHTPSTSSTPESIGSPVAKIELDLMNYLLKVDREVRSKKLDKFRVQSEVKRLSIANGTAKFRNENDEFYVEGLHVVSVPDMVSVSSEELYSMIQWANLLPGFRELPVPIQTKLLRNFAYYHILLELSYHTAKSGLDDVWLFPNDSFMPRDISTISPEKLKVVTKGRRWRQEKLYNNMTAQCIDEVAMPMRRMSLQEQEFVVLKLIMLFRNDGDVFWEDGLMEESISSATNDVRGKIRNFRNQAIKALFAFYQSIEMENFAERFGNVLLSISGIVSAAAALQQSYQVMRVFDICPFDTITKELLFNGGTD